MAADAEGGPYRVMVCDDSAVIRGLITRALESDPDIQVVTTVSNGQLALSSLSRFSVEVCILDIEMPVMDGLTALPKMIDQQPDLQVIIASTLTRRNAEISLKALADGAADYLTKPTTTIQGGTDFKIELVAKVKALGASRRRIRGIPRPQSQAPQSTPSHSYTLPSAAPAQGMAPQAPAATSYQTAHSYSSATHGTVPQAPPSVARMPGTGFTPSDAAHGRAAPAPPEHRPFADRAAAAPSVARPPSRMIPPSSTAGVPHHGAGHSRQVNITLRPYAGEAPEIIAIGSSTGGPQALFSLSAALGKNLAQPIVITQHMPATFTTILAEHIERASGIPTVEGAEGMALQAGRAYVAPGDFHMTIEGSPGQRILRLLKTPQENFCRPSVDPMLRSLVKAYGRRILVIMLTGMGHDGQKGAEAVVAAGGNVVAQDEATSVVWGMPGAVATAGLCTAVLPLPEIAPYIRRVLGKAV